MITGILPAIVLCLKFIHEYQLLLSFSVLEYSYLVTRPSLIAGLDCGLDRWTGLLDWITGSNQTASKGDDACVVH